MSGTFTFDKDPLELIGSAEVYTPINISIGITFIPDEESPGVPSDDIINSISIIADLEDSEIILNTNIDSGSLTGSANITGNHSLEIFPGSEIKFLPKGGTDKVDPVTIVNNVNNVPVNKDVFSVKSDPNQQKVITYTVTATSVDGSIKVESYEYLATQTYTAMRDWLINYDL